MTRGKRLEDWGRYFGDMLTNWGAWLWLMLVSLCGATSSHLSRRRRHKLPFSLVEFLGEAFASGFAGFLTALACASLGADYYLTMFLVGIAGHIGGRLTWMFARRVEARVDALLDKILGPENPKP